jgi:hypothetical protein
MTKGSPAPGRPHRSAGSRYGIADGGGYGGRGLVDGAVPGFHEPELRIRQGAGELAALFWWPGTVVAVCLGPVVTPCRGSRAC